MDKKSQICDIVLKLECIQSICMALNECNDITGYSENIFYFLGISLNELIQQIVGIEELL